MFLDEVGSESGACLGMVDVAVAVSPEGAGSIGAVLLGLGRDGLDPDPPQWKTLAAVARTVKRDAASARIPVTRSEAAARGVLVVLRRRR